MDTTPGPKKERRDFSSSFIRWAEYSRHGGTLVVCFTTGHTRAFQGVGLSVWEDWKAAASAGSFFHQNIKGRYPSEQVHEDPTADEEKPPAEQGLADITEPAIDPAETGRRWRMNLDDALPVALMRLADGRALEVWRDATRNNPAQLEGIRAWLEPGDPGTPLHIEATSDVLFVDLGMRCEAPPVFPNAAELKIVGIPGAWTLIPESQPKLPSGVMFSDRYHSLRAGERLVIHQGPPDHPLHPHIDQVRAKLEPFVDFSAFDRYPHLAHMCDLFSHDHRTVLVDPDTALGVERTVAWYMQEANWRKRNGGNRVTTSNWYTALGAHWGDGMTNGHYHEGFAVALAYLQAYRRWQAEVTERSAQRMADTYAFGLELVRATAALGMVWTGSNAGLMYGEKGMTRRGAGDGVRKSKQWFSLSGYVWHELSGCPFLRDALTLHTERMMADAPEFWYRGAHGIRRLGRPIDELLATIRLDTDAALVERARVRVAELLDYAYNGTAYNGQPILPEDAGWWPNYPERRVESPWMASRIWAYTFRAKALGVDVPQAILERAISNAAAVYTEFGQLLGDGSAPFFAMPYRFPPGDTRLHHPTSGAAWALPVLRYLAQFDDAAKWQPYVEAAERACFGQHGAHWSDLEQIPPNIAAPGAYGIDCPPWGGGGAPKTTRAALVAVQL